MKNSWVWLLVLLVFPMQALAQDWTPHALLEALQVREPREVPFTQTRESPLTAKPVTSSGLFILTPPARVEKKTLAPVEEEMVIENGDVRIRTRIEKSYRTSHMAINSHPMLQASAGSMYALFTGNEKALREDYDLTLGGDEKAWSLLLRPRSAALQTYVLDITLTGSAGIVRQVVVRTARSERITLTFGAPR